MVTAIFKVIIKILFFLSIYVYCQRNEDFLPINTKPVRYTLTIEVINLTNYRGSVLFELEALEDSKNVTFHSQLLDINKESIKVVDSDGNAIEYLNSTINKENDFYTINLEDYLHKNKKYNVTIGEFVGSTTRNQNTGFYRVEYFEPNKTKKYLTVTQFEPLFARKAFPCFDEPRLKATFIIKLIRPSDKVSASNMPLLETIDLGNNRFQDVYQESVLMSTYLVAFIICEYKYSKNNGIIRMFAPQEYIDNGSLDYILKESKGILTAVEKYTDIKYYLPKLDFVIINKDYIPYGGMENVGLITLSDLYIVCPNTSTSTQFQTCHTFATHEIVHHWFGNLATQKSWHYMWLSEGFANYFQYHIPHKIKPDWRLNEQFVLNVLYLSLNSEFEDEPLNYVFSEECQFPNPENYYFKAGSIIRMTSHFLTEKLFQDAMRLYLKKNQFKATAPEDLYEAYENALKNANQENLLKNLTINEILSTWYNIPGHPIVTVTRNYELGSITFTQRNSLNNYNNSVWYIPITYVLQDEGTKNFNETVTDFWFTEGNVTIYPNVTNGWLLVNKLTIGYYQVNYDETNWKRLIEFLHSKDYHLIPPLNRAQLINDAFYFAKEKLLDYKILFNLTNYLKQETDYIPIFSFLRNVKSINSVINNIEDKTLIQNYVNHILTTSYNKLGFESKDTDTHTDKLLRTELLDLLCSHKQECKNFGLELFNNWRNSGIFPITGDVDTSLLCTALEMASIEDFDFLREQYLLNKNAHTSNLFLKLFLCFKDKQKINKTLDLFFNLNYTIPPKDRTTTINSIADSYEGRYAVLEHVLKLKQQDGYKDAFLEDPGIQIIIPLNKVAEYDSEIRQIAQGVPVALIPEFRKRTNLKQIFVN